MLTQNPRNFEDVHGPLEALVVEQDTSSIRLRKLFHSLGLETVYLLFQEIRGHSAVEEKKIAVVVDLRSACYVSLLHLIPTSASVVLLVFNWRGYYIGGELSGPVGEDNLKFLGLQFAAKMLELLTMASLSTILFALVRRQLISNSVPLGAVTAGFKFDKISLLWSKEFVATCATRFSTSGQKFLLIATVIIFTILGATIGPSAAVAVQPVLRDWPAGVFPEKVLVSGRQSMRTMAARFKGPFIYQPELTAATAPSSAIADVVSQLERYFIANAHQCSVGKARFCYYKDMFFSVNAKQPVTYVRCSASDLNETVRFPRLDQGNGNYPLVKYNKSTIGSQQWFDVSTGQGSHPGLSWVELPQADFGQSSIGAVVALPWTDIAGKPGQVLACTIDARWADATATVSFLGGQMIASGSPTDWYTGGQLQLESNGSSSWPQVKIAPKWATSINPSIAEPSMSAFSVLCNSVGRFDNVSLAPSPINAVEAVLALMLTDGLAQTGSMAMILGSLKGLANYEWTNEMLPRGSVFGSGGSVFDYSYKAGDPSTKLVMETTVTGYGYGVTTAKLLSTIVLFIYSFIAMAYTVYSICYEKTTSSSWESITELIVLAMNSAPSSVLQNTGAGIATLKTLKEPVRIAVSDDQLQMIFEDGERLEKVAENRFYG
ncbi:MAG: hypothetical protein M1818_003270 [Claussenomyces sp. TS43310]|nr:MAG: hypothetical protein M1818_003270 [Claussenomyces sp. TS43310]